MPGLAGHDCVAGHDKYDPVMIHYHTQCVFFCLRSWPVVATQVTPGHDSEKEWILGQVKTGQDRSWFVITSHDLIMTRVMTGRERWWLDPVKDKTLVLLGRKYFDLPQYQDDANEQEGFCEHFRKVKHDGWNLDKCMYGDCSGEIAKLREVSGLFTRRNSRLMKMRGDCTKCVMDVPCVCATSSCNLSCSLQCQGYIHIERAEG